MNSLIKSFIKDEVGQTSTEYILLLAVVAVIVMRFKAVAIPKIEELIAKIFDTKILDDLNG